MNHAARTRWPRAGNALHRTTGDCPVRRGRRTWFPQPPSHWREGGSALMSDTGTRDLAGSFGGRRRALPVGEGLRGRVSRRFSDRTVLFARAPAGARAPRRRAAAGRRRGGGVALLSSRGPNRPRARDGHGRRPRRAAAPAPAPTSRSATRTPPASAPGPNASGACPRSRRAYAYGLGRPVTSFRACGGATHRRRAAPASSTPFPRDTRLVTITIGGNDAGFVDVIETLPLRRAGALRRRVGAGGALRAQELAARLRRVYEAIRERAPQATVVVAGYPRLFARRPWCSRVGRIDDREQRRLNEGEQPARPHDAAEVAAPRRLSLRRRARGVQRRRRLLAAHRGSSASPARCSTRFTPRRAARRPTRG